MGIRASGAKGKGKGRGTRGEVKGKGRGTRGEVKGRGECGECGNQGLRRGWEADAPRTVTRRPFAKSTRMVSLSALQPGLLRYVVHGVHSR